MEEEERMDYYDPVLGKNVCVHEGTLQEIMRSEDMDTNNVDEWIDDWVFLNLKK